MRFSRLLPAFVAAAFLAVPSPALAWGKTGHRVAAAIADHYLSGYTRARIEQIFGPESLDEAATWPDEMRADPAPFWQKVAGPWHYVTVSGTVYDSAPREGDAVVALERFRKVLRNPASSLADRQLALRFIVHIVADLHQPLHAGRPGDRGANEVKVTWFGKPTNLHAVWDSSLVDDQQLSFSELAARLRRHISSDDVIALWDAEPRDWIRESVAIRETIYPTSPELGYDYAYRNTPIVNRRLQWAGIRLAAYLNATFDPAPSMHSKGRK